MAEDKIRHDEIIENDLFRNTEKSAEDLLATLDRLEQSFIKTGQAASKSFGNPQTLAQLKAEAEAIKAIDKAEVELTEIQKQKITVAEKLSALRIEEQRQKDALRKQFADEARAEKEKLKLQKQSNDAYSKLSQRHKELKRDAMNLAAAYGVESKQAQAATQAAAKLDAQLKKIDASVGVHTRNVGNYQKAWSGITSVLSTFGITMGAGAIIGGLKDSIGAFVEAEKNAKALEFALKNVGGEGEIAFQKLITQSEKLQESGGVFSDDDIQKAQLQLVNYGLVSDEVEKLMPKILDLATATGQDLGSATDTVIKGMNGQVKGLKMVGLGFDDTGSRAGNYNVILDKLTKFEGAAADAAQTTEGKYKVLMNRFDDMQEDIGEFLVNTGSEYLAYWDLLVGKLDAVDEAQKRIRQNTFDSLDPLVKGYIAQVDLIEGTGQKIVFINEKLISMQQLTLKYNEELKKANGTGDIETARGAEAQVKGIQDQINVLNELKQTILNPAKGSGGGDGDGTKEKEKQKGRTAEMKRYYKEQNAENQKAIDKDRKDEADNLKLIADHDQHRLKLHNDYLSEKERREQEAHDKQKKQYADDVAALKEANQKKLEDAVRLEEKLSDAAFDGMNKRFDRMEQDLQDEATVIDDELKRQSDRQLAGLENSYAEQQKLKAENQAKQAELDEKRRKSEEAKELAELFIEFTKAYAKNGDINAAQKALAESIAVRAIANTIAGSFYEGTEDTGTVDRPMDNKGGRLAILHNNERVIPKRLNRMIDGMSNDDLIERALMFDGIYKPQLMAAMQPEDSRNFRRSEPDIIGSAVLNQLVSLEKTVRDKPESKTEWSHTEKAMVTTLKAWGVTKKIVHKRF